MLIGNQISSKLFPLKLKDKLLFAKETLLLYGVNVLPVVEQNKVLGYVQSDKILDEDDQIQVKDVLQSYSSLSGAESINFLQASDHINRALIAMASDKHQVKPVFDQDKYIGLISWEEIINHFGASYTNIQPGAYIDLLVNWNDFSISKLCSIIEGDGFRLLQLNYFENPGDALVRLSIKLNEMKIERIIAALKRHGYTVVQTYQEDKSEYNLDDRYQSLLKYLDL